LIDLHLHSNASDGTLPPSELVARAAAAGLAVISLTDHDTTAGIREARAAAVARGVAVVSGIEITAVEQGRDIHVLGYFIDDRSRELAAFLEAQRADRVRRVREMAERLEGLGCPIDVEPMIDAVRSGHSIGRPALADALVAAGHAAGRDDAFARLIGEGRPAFVARRGLSVRDVAGIIHAAGGIASLAHPGLSRIDELIPGLAAGALDALEVRHSDHPPDVELRYRSLAERLGLAVSGGSDFHGDGTHRAAELGAVTLSGVDFSALQSRALAGRPS
jgi:predicted metal-dependent phosphoesterase TrpH